MALKVVRVEPVKRRRRNNDDGDERRKEPIIVNQVDCTCGFSKSYQRLFEAYDAAETHKILHRADGSGHFPTKFS